MLWLRWPGLARDLAARGCAFHVCNQFAPYCHYLAGRDSALRFTEPDTSDRLVDRAQRKAVSKSLGHWGLFDQHRLVSPGVALYRVRGCAACTDWLLRIGGLLGPVPVRATFSRALWNGGLVTSPAARGASEKAFRLIAPAFGRWLVPEL